MEPKENAVDQDLTVTVVLPGGLEKVTTVQGSKPVMDLLVTLCAKYHLNPSSHTAELISANRNNIKFKPNALIGTLEAEKILIKPKGTEEKKKRTGPQMPEATVRLIINHKKTQKTILRVNPQVPLEELMPAVCEKCEFDQKTTILLRDVHSDQPLDLTKSLNDYGLREVYAKDKEEMSPANWPASPPHQESKSPPDKFKNAKEKQNKGFFSMFRKSKKKNSQAVTLSAPASPVLVKHAASSEDPQDGSAPGYCSNTMPPEGSKKRRAPLPPVMASLSFPFDLSQNQSDGQPGASVEEEQVKPGLSRGSSESSLKRTKRKAPPPPGTVSQGEMPSDRTVKVGQTSLNTLEEITEQEERACAPCANSGAMRENWDADISMGSHVDERRSRLLEDTGKDEPSGLSTDGNVAKDPVSCKEHREEVVKTTETGVQLECSDLDSGLSEGMNEQAGASGEVARTLVVEEKKLSPASLSTTQAPVVQAPVVQAPVVQAPVVQAPVCRDVGTSKRDRRESTAAPVKTHAVASLGVQASCDESPPVKPLGPEPSAPAQQRRDMATSTEELNPEHGVPVLPQSTVAHQDHVASVDTSVKESDLRTKPCDELTRDYKPKVGLTTYTIMPTKSREKLKVFEVELTLEAPGVNKQRDGASLELAGCLPQTSGPQVSMSPSGDHRYYFQRGPQMTNGASTSNDTHCSDMSLVRSPGIPEPDGSSSEPSFPSGGGVQACPVLQGSQKKIPPAIRPKPGSFRSPQHKPMPGYYVTSAAAKDMSGSAGYHQRDPHTGPNREAPLEASGDDGFPLPPPPVHWENVPDEITLAPKASGAMLPKLMRQQSAPVKATSAGFNMDKHHYFAAPKPYVVPSTSRFAQAVASAVKRSQSFTRDSSSSSCASSKGRYSAIELGEPSGDEEHLTLGVKAANLQEVENPRTSPGYSLPGRFPDDGGQWKIHKVPEPLPSMAMAVNGSSVQDGQLE